MRTTAMALLDRAKAAKPENDFLVPKDAENLIPWLKRKLEKGKSRIPDEQIRMNMAFVLGHQWSIWDSSRGMWKRPTQRPNDPNPPVRITVNKIGTLVERTIAKLTKEVMIPEARPASDSVKDVDAAKVDTRILTHEMDRVQ